MKLIYKAIIFFAIFQVTVMMVNAMDVFPNTLYSDQETEELEGLSAEGLVVHWFTVDGTILGHYVSGLTIGVLVTLIAVVGAGVSFATHSFVPVIVSIMGIAIWPMLVNSQSFFDKLITNWDSQSLTYLALCLGVGIILIVIITIIETPTHGRSG